MVAFYKHDIAAWMHGTASLRDGSYRAYHIICQMIYEHEGPLPLNERYLAGACNQSLKSFRVNLRELIEAGKLTLHEGVITNHRAEIELKFVQENRKHAHEGGIRSGETRRKGKKLNENKDNHEAVLHEDRSLREKRRLEKTREERLLCARAHGAVIEEEFEEFWRSYPARYGGNARKPAKAQFESEVKRGADPKKIIGAIRASVGFDPDKIGTKYIPHAVKWLRDRRYEDWATGPPSATDQPAYLQAPPGAKSHAEIMASLRKATNGQEVATEVRSNAGVGSNGAGHDPELRIPGGGSLFPEIQRKERGTSDD